jgi:hypothetical protein
MFTANLTFVYQSFSDPFGWGWNFLGGAGAPWHQLWPRAIPWIQVICILAGFSYAVRNAWRIAMTWTSSPSTAMRSVLPFGFFLLAFAAWGVWFFAN